MKNSLLIFLVSLILGCSSEETQNQEKTNTPKSVPFDDTIETAIENNSEKVLNHKNFVDSLGRKQGLWITEKGIKIECYYKDDLRHGEFKSHHKNGEIYGLGNYNNGEKVSKWYTYNENGKLKTK